MIFIEQADARTLPLEDESVDCIVTSPPYLALRDYGIPPSSWPEVVYVPLSGAAPIVVAAEESCLGLESTIEAYVGHMVLVARELRRVLKKTGTMWLNLGDTYASAWNTGAGWDSSTLTKKSGGARNIQRAQEASKRKNCRPGVPRKNLLGIPWRVALALQADGWCLRNEIIWHKRSPLPESCRDRATVSHEHLFLLTRRPKYYFNQEAWLEPCSPSTRLRVGQENWANQAGSARANAGGKTNGPMKAVIRGSGNKERKLGDDYGRPGHHRGTGIPWEPTGETPLRNRRTVWTVSSEPTSDAHYASYPTALVEPCIKAGCPRHGVVLDPFCGRGTTLLVANQLDCDGYGFDLDPKSIDMARRRVTPDLVDGLFAKTV